VFNTSKSVSETEIKAPPLNFVLQPVLEQCIEYASKKEIDWKRIYLATFPINM
jgi:hypothetical protein